MRLIEPLLAVALTAAPAWSQERLVSALGDRQASYDAVVTAGSGGGLVGATFGECSAGFAAMAAAAPPPVTELHEELWAGPIATGDQYAAVLNRQRCGGKTLDLVDVAADGQVRRRTALPVKGYPYPVELASGAGGSLVVAWCERLSDTRSRVRVLVRGGRPRTLATQRLWGESDPGVGAIRVAAGANGRALVAWTTEKHVYAATLSRSGRAGRAAVVGASMGVAEPAVALGAGGREIVAWSTHDGGEERNERTRVYAAMRDGSRFRPAKQLERAPAIDEFYDVTDPDGRPRVAVAPDGRALVAWSVAARRGFRVRLAAARPGHGFGARRTLADDGAPGEVGFAPDGAALATWAAGGEISLERAGVAEPVATAEAPAAPTLTAHADGRLRVAWITGLDSYAPELHVATSQP